MGIFCTSQAVVIKAGADVNTALNTEYETYFIPYAESYICDYCSFNYRDAYSGLNSDASLLLNDVCSNLAAIYAISYDMAGYPNMNYASNTINILKNRAMEGLEILKNNKDFISNA